MSIHDQLCRGANLVACTIIMGGCGDWGWANEGETDSGDPPFPHEPWICFIGTPHNPSSDNYWTNVNNVVVPGTDVQVCLLSGGDEAAARAACSAKCVDLSAKSYVCEDEKWHGAKSQTGPCKQETELYDLVIEGMLGSSAALALLDLPCELDSSCAEYLPSSARAQLWHTPTSSAASTAETRAQTRIATPSSIGFIGRGTTSRTTMGVTGNAAYTAVACEADACPFYFAQLEVTQGSGSKGFTFNIPGSSAPLVKQLSAIRVSLARSTLGVWLPSTGDVIFAPHALRLSAAANVAGATNTYGENGPYTQLEYANAGYVLGHVDATSFTLRDVQRDALGDVSLQLKFGP